MFYDTVFTFTTSLYEIGSVSEESVVLCMKGTSGNDPIRTQAPKGKIDEHFLTNNKITDDTAS